MPCVIHRAQKLESDGCLAGTTAIEIDDFSVLCKGPDGRTYRILPEGDSFTLYEMSPSGRVEAERGYGARYILMLKRFADNTDSYTESAWNEEGQRIYESIVRDGTGISLKTFHPNGQTESEGPLENEARSGTWTFYDDTGKKLRTEEW
mgnify:CR=1 FL=1